MKTNSSSVKLTEFSHGAGCGCKISPKLLKEIIGTNIIIDGFLQAHGAKI